MSTANAKDAAAQWIAEHKLPDDLSGQTVNLVTFESDEDCLYFYPHRVLVWQQKVNKFLGRAIRKRKGTVGRVVVTPATYREWLQKSQAPDSPFRRRAFADSLQGVEAQR